MDEDLAFALEPADVADAISLVRFRGSGLAVERKPDGTLVTDADRSVERAVRERIATGRDGDPVEAQVSFDSIGGLEEHGLLDRFAALAWRCWRTRAFGDFWQHMLVAEGAVDVVVEPSVALWDLAATKVIVEEAGGRLTDLTGVSTADGGNALSTNGLLPDEVLTALGP